MDPESESEETPHPSLQDRYGSFQILDVQYVHNGAVKFRLLILIELGVVTGNSLASKSSFTQTALPNRVDT